MPHLRHHIPFSHRILTQVLLLYLSLVEYFHCKLFLVSFPLNEVDFPEGAVAKELLRHKIVWTKIFSEALFKLARSQMVISGF